MPLFKYNLEEAKEFDHISSLQTKLPSEETLEEKIVKLENENQMLKLNQEISDLLIMDLNLKNEEMSIMLLVLNQGISEFEAMNEDRNELEMYKEKLEEACDALDTANFELECELDAMKLTCERLQNDLEKSQVRRKELEDSLLAQVVFGESLIQERRIEEQHVKEAENDKLRFLHIIEEKDKILELLQKEVEWLEHESFKKEFESAVVVKRYMEGSKSKEHEKEKFIHLMNSRRMKLDEIINQMDSLQKKLSDSLTRFSSKHEDDHPHGHYCYDHSEEGAEALFLLLERLKKENTSLIENANNLALDKERLLNFVLGLGDKMFEFSSSDKELMDLLRSMMECFDQNKDDDDDNDNDDDGILVSENVIMNSPTGFEIEA